MSCRHLGRTVVVGIVAQLPLAEVLFAAGSPALAQADQRAPGLSADACAGDNGGITLPHGFCATIFADNIGHARHLVVSPKGIVYVNTWSGRYYGNDTPPPGGFLVALQDTTGDGHADVTIRFGDSLATGSHGGTGIALYKDALYAEVNDRIVRYALPEGAIVPTTKPEVIVSGLPLSGDHPMHPFVIDRQGNLYVDLGSATNSCQVRNRTAQSPGVNPCRELKTRAGTWRYDANRTGQRFSPAERFATGIRNGEGFAFDQAGRMYVIQHGRDQLAENWPNLYRPEQGANLPAEELLLLEKGANYGWPQCYFDGEQQKLVLAPSMAATAARPSELAGRSTVRSRRFQPIGRPTISQSTMAGSFPMPIGEALSSPSTARGTGRRFPRAAITWCSSRSPTARHRASSLCSPTASRAPSRNLARRRIGRPALRWGRTGRCTFRMMPAGASGA